MPRVASQKRTVWSYPAVASTTEGFGIVSLVFFFFFPFSLLQDIDVHEGARSVEPQQSML